MSNKGDRIINQLLSKLKQNNPQYDNLDQLAKINYLRQELKTLGLFVDKSSQEMQSFENLRKINEEMNNSLKRLMEQIKYSNISTNLIRFTFNINNIIECYAKMNFLVSNYKRNIKPYESLFSKYIKKIPTSSKILSISISPKKKSPKATKAKTQKAQKSPKSTKAKSQKSQK